MKMSENSPDAAPAAMTQAIGLFRPSLEARWRVRAGYVDLLGEEDPIGSTFLQRAMGGRLVPRIYERLWRPIAIRFLCGFFGPTRARERRMALEMLAIGPEDLVLDIGCGPGNFTRCFAQAADPGLVVGFDASTTMLAAAARRGSHANLAYMRGDACALPFDEAEFDAVFCFAMLHLLNDPFAALDGMARALAPGGRFALMATWKRRERSPRWLRGIRVFGRDELTAALASRGLVDVEQSVSGWAQFVSARKPEA
jgi:SAM-dependent methyltransferase